MLRIGIRFTVEEVGEDGAQETMKRAHIVLALAACAAAVPAWAQSYPAKPIRLIVPFPPGAGTDVVSRVVATRYSEASGHRIVVENRPGATGSIGLDAVAKSPPDGYTLGVLIVSHAVHAAVEPKLPYDLTRDFTPVIQFNTIPYVLVVNPTVPAKTVEDLVRIAKGKPGLLRYGSSGTGGVIHLAGAWLASATGTEMIHVPYKGNGPAITDLVGGRIDFIISNISSFAGFLKAQKLRALAVTSPRRIEQLPELPTMQEAGIRDYAADGWYGLAGPSSLPPTVVSLLNGGIATVLQHPETRAALATDASTAVGGAPKDFATHIAAEVEKWRRIVQQAGIKIE
jgi:tripartite-type tricarboxylate transporter receptor subunit TctC